MFFLPSLFPSLWLQRAWLYLQPIFASEDIQRQLPAEAKRFAGADKTWRATMQAAKGSSAAASAAAAPSATAAPTAGSAHGGGGGGASSSGPQPFSGAKALPLCSNAKLRDRFAESNKLLELVQKGLSDYLETKRSAFPRAYFLSDAELLEILSQARDPAAVQVRQLQCINQLS